MDITVKILTVGIVVYSGGQFKEDINTENPLGTGGKLAIIFANLMSNLWSGKDRSLSPYKLKVTKKKRIGMCTLLGISLPFLLTSFIIVVFIHADGVFLLKQMVVL